MTRSRIAHMRWLTAVLAALVLTGWRTAAAQSPPPVQGTIALEGTMKTFYRAANVVIVTTMDGVEHAYHFTRDLVVHGRKDPVSTRWKDCAKEALSSCTTQQRVPTRPFARWTSSAHGSGAPGRAARG